MNLLYATVRHRYLTYARRRLQAETPDRGEPRGKPQIRERTDESANLRHVRSVIDETIYDRSTRHNSSSSLSLVSQNFTPDRRRSAIRGPPAGGRPATDASKRSPSSEQDSTSPHVFLLPVRQVYLTITIYIRFLLNTENSKRTIGRYLYL